MSSWFTDCSGSLSLADMLPKVETRVVLVGAAGQDQVLLKALQVNKFCYFTVSAL